MTEATQSARTYGIRVAALSWLLPLVGILGLTSIAGAYALEVQIIEWLIALIVIVSGLLIPTGCGVSIACCLLSRGIPDPAFRAHAVVGLWVGIALIAMFAFCLFTGSSVEPFIYAI